MIPADKLVLEQLYSLMPFMPYTTFEAVLEEVSNGTVIVARIVGEDRGV